MIIIKVGGAKEINWEAIISDIKEISKTEKVIVVHGASQTRDEIAEKLGSPSKVITSPSGMQSVYTDSDAMDIFLMSYAGVVNKRIVEKFQMQGINAIGLTGADAKIWEGERKQKTLSKEGEKVRVLRDNMTGRVRKINVEFIENLLDLNILPIITPPAISTEGELINVDNDLAIAVMAKSLKTEKLIVLFEAGGFMKDINDPDSLIKSLNLNEIPEYEKYAKGRMKKKLMGAQEALDGGVDKVYWGGLNVENPILKALNGEGTIISK
ncbi:MAG TPA: [LysW]-aminoadipate kinase [Candidatus Dojkabacteria bacterium]|jgi:acetylglutamate/LysW-gamma-L-alpha-aminoadipate kinase